MGGVKNYRGGQNITVILWPAGQYIMGVKILSHTGPGKLDIQRRKHGILFISLPIVSLFKLAIMT